MIRSALFLLLFVPSICPMEVSKKMTLAVYEDIDESKHVTLHVDKQQVGYVNFSSVGSSIDLLYVDPAYRGCGYGSMLLGYAIDKLRQTGAYQVSLEVEPFEYFHGAHMPLRGSFGKIARTKLVAFYRRHGFECDPSRISPLRNPIFKKHLK